MERICEPMNKKRIRGGAAWGERAGDREAAVNNGLQRRSGGCAEKVSVLTWGDLASCPKGRRVHDAEREVSRGRSRPRRETVPKDRTMGRASRPGVSM